MKDSSFNVMQTTKARVPALNTRDRLLKVALMFIFGLVLIELALQWRAHLRWGESIFDVAAQSETRHVKDPQTGLLLLRPNHVFSSQQQIIRSNSLGFRSPELITPRPDKGLRIAVIGASTVFGAYAADNDLTFSQILAAKLKQAYPDKTVEVINAGLVGLSLKSQLTILSRMVLPVRPDWVILYTGTNDFVRFCKQGKPGNQTAPKRQPLWRPNLTSNLLSYELVTKNTRGIRQQFAPLLWETEPDNLDLGSIENTLRKFVKEATDANVKVLLTTNTHSYRQDQPLAQQEKLAATALYYNYCFSLAGLYKMHDRYNALIRAVAASTGANLVPLDRLVPGGAQYFADASHFSSEGERAVAQILFSHLTAELDTEAKPLSPTYSSEN